MTVREAAKHFGISRRQVQKDVERGCDGIVRPGSAGRGNSTLLDLAAYRAWRECRTGDVSVAVQHERDRAFELLCNAALLVFREGGVSGLRRQIAAQTLVALLPSFYAALMRKDLDHYPPQMRTLIRVFVPSEHLPFDEDDQ